MYVFSQIPATESHMVQCLDNMYGTVDAIFRSQDAVAKENAFVYLSAAVFQGDNMNWHLITGLSSDIGIVEGCTRTYFTEIRDFSRS